MIISKETFENATVEEIKEWCTWYNNNVETKFFIRDEKFWIGEGYGIPLRELDFKKDIKRTDFMTEEEFKQEVEAGNVYGVKATQGGFYF